MVILGGPMSAYDPLPWLEEEKRFIDGAIREGKKVLGICLGAQLIADVLGAKVYPGPEKEIGWFPVTLSEAAQESRLFAEVPHEIIPLHWHGDTFDLPKGASRLASSELTPNQAFSLGTTVLALQFHLEMRRKDAEAIVENCGHELKSSQFVQEAHQILGETPAQREADFLRNERLCERVLENFYSAKADR